MRRVVLFTAVLALAVGGLAAMTVSPGDTSAGTNGFIGASCIRDPDLNCEDVCWCIWESCLSSGVPRAQCDAVRDACLTDCY